MAARLADHFGARPFATGGVILSAIGFVLLGSLFASFLGYNPMGTLLAPVLPHLPHATAAYLTGHRFFPSLVSQPFASGIHTVFYFAAVCCLVAAVASWLRGGKYYHAEAAEPVETNELAEVA